MVDIISDFEPLLGCFPQLLMVAQLAAPLIGFMGQQQAAKRQKAYQEYTADLVDKAGKRQQSALIAKNIQEGEAAAREKYAISQQGEAAQAEARLSALEGGVSGLSIDHLLDSFTQQEAQYKYAVTEEQRLKGIELDRRLQDVALGTQQKMYAARAPINQPSLLAASLSGLSAAGDTFGKYYKFKKGEGYTRRNT